MADEAVLTSWNDTPARHAITEYGWTIVSVKDDWGTGFADP